LAESSLVSSGEEDLATALGATFPEGFSEAPSSLHLLNRSIYSGDGYWKELPKNLLEK